MTTLGDLIQPGGDLSETQAASRAFIPGHDAQSFETGTDAGSTREPIIDGDFTLPGKAPDLKFSSLKALNHYARTTRVDEVVDPEMLLPAGAQDASGLSRHDEIVSPTSGYLAGAAPNLQSLHVTKNASLGQLPNADTLEATTISGHDTIGSRFVSKTLRDFTNQLEQLTEDGSYQSSFGSKHSSDKDTVSGSPDYATIQNLIKLNRFSPGSSSPFLKADGTGEERLSKGLFSLQSGEFGRFVPGRKGVTVEHLRKAALETLLRAQSVSADESTEVAEGIFSSGNPYFGSDSLYINPHVTQIGVSTIGVDGLRIRSSQVMDVFATENKGIRARGADDLIALSTFDRGMFSTGEEDPTTKARIKNGTSYGTLNSPSEQFGGVAPFGMVLPAFYSIIAFGLFALLLGSIIAALANVGGRDPGTNPEAPWTYPFGGNYNGSDTDIGEKFLKMFGLSRETPLELTSMAFGVMMYYGINFNPVFPGTSGAEAVNSLINLLLGPGFYTTVAKRVLQDFAQVTESFANYTNISFGNVFGSITILLSSIESLMSSFTIRFFILMNNLGKIMEDAIDNPGAKAHGGSIIKLTEQDRENVLTPERRNKISRYHASSAEVMSPLSLHLFDSLWMAAPTQANVGQIGATMVGKSTGVRELPSSKGRLPKEVVDHVENQIDAEYIPFSIHDLRTNEVIGLPAFISNISDDFNANYNSSHGFGRTDPVYSYAKTTRSIQLTFDLVAMNKTDHSYMWGVINKLIAMLYPQRDIGTLRMKEIEDADAKVHFIQPFSQRVAASPVVRIRVGDVIASNRNADTMRRLFGGVHLKSSALEDGVPVAEGAEAYLKSWYDTRERNSDIRSTRLRAQRMAKERMASMMKLKLEAETQANVASKIEEAGGIYLKEGLKAQVEVKGKRKSITLAGPIRAASIDYVAEETGGKNNNQGAAKPTGKKPTSNGTYRIGIDLNDEAEAYGFGGVALLAKKREVDNAFPIPLPFVDPPKVELIVKDNNLADGFGFMNSDAAYPALISEGTYHNTLLLRALKRADAQGQKDIDTEARKEIEEETEFYKTMLEMEDKIEGVDKVSIDGFLEPANNAVVRAFDSASGRGLAGVITQCSLDYNQALWGTSREAGMSESNLRAPKSVRITLSFSPIHDVTLGLNSEGELFAPSHPAGELAKPIQRVLHGGLSTVAEALEKHREKIKNTVTNIPDTENPGDPGIPLG